MLGNYFLLGIRELFDELVLQYLGDGETLVGVEH